MIERPEQMNIDATFGVTFAEGNFFINFYHQLMYALKNALVSMYLRVYQNLGMSVVLPSR